MLDRGLSIVLLLLLAFCANAQEDSELWGLYKSNDNEEVVRRFRAEYYQYRRDAAAHNIVSRAYYAIGAYDSTRYYAEKAIYLDGDSTVVAAWSHVFLGYAFYFMDSIGWAKDEMYRVIRMNINEYCNRSANAFLNITNLLPMFEGWVTVEHEHIRYHFQSGRSSGRYMSGQDKAYNELKTIFKPRLSKKIDYYVWADRRQAKQHLQKGLGYSVPEVAVVNTAADQSKGHELTHVLSYWGWGQEVTVRTRLIDEGLSVCFDMAPRGLSRIEEGRVTINAYKGKVKTITDLWKQGLYDEDELFFLPVAGAFVHYLYEHSTEDEFRRVVKDQTIENARKVYGSRFDELIRDFDRKMYLNR